jgi:small redox-active disulfide protein 2
MLEVKVLGSDCANCQRLERETRAALSEAGITYHLEKVTDYSDIAAYGVLSTPALVINEKVVAVGRIPAHAKIVELARSHNPEAL